jgi:zinc D-Ala-D-Ala carboxypeptidase
MGASNQLSDNKPHIRNAAKPGMRLFNLNIALFAVVIAAATAVAFQTRIGRGQTQTPEVQSPVKTTVLRTSNADKSSTHDSAANSVVFESAAAKNAVLFNDLTWTFGGKQQHGWYLYQTLINRLLKTEADASSPAFASALAKWQQQSKLNATGILDEDSLNAMVSEWQRNRLKDRVYAQPDQLFTAPVSEFYDPQRAENLRQVQRETYAAYKKMIAAAIADPSLGLAHTSTDQLAPTEKYLKILSAFRPREYQEQLRRQSPNAGSAGLAINSPHFTGRALDLYVGGDPVDTKDSNRAIQVQTAVYKWLVRNAGRFGFRPYYYEPWHWEYVGISEE